jgi:hypothetical protein
MTDKPKAAKKITKNLVDVPGLKIVWMVIPSINIIPKIEIRRYTIM